MPKLNLEFYKEDIDYDISMTKQEQDDVIKYINKYKEFEYKEIFQTDIRVPIFVNLSDIRNNIVNWYPFKENCDILEIGCGFGSITGELCKKCKNITSIEFTKIKAEAVCKRHEDKDNLEVICGKLDDITFGKKFDYISLIDIAEYANIIMNNNNGLEVLLEYCKKLLKDDGVILLAINNKLGIKKITTTNLEESLNNKVLYTKENLNNIIKKSFSNFKYYYPLPDYKLVNVIYSDDYLPNCNDSKIRYNRYNYPNIKSLNNELDIFKDIIENNCFETLTNSYFIEINNKVNNNIKFVSFNNMRKTKYKLKTIINNKKVSKQSINIESEYQINAIKNNIDVLKDLGFEVLDRYNENTIESDYVDYLKLDKIIINKFMDNKIEEGLKLINNYFEFLKKKLNKSENNENYLDINDIKYEEYNFNFVKYGFIDLTFENIFVGNDNNYIVFDQEWCLKDVPMEFILYRAIHNLFCYNPEIENKISKDKIFKTFNLDKYLDIFSKIEENIQSDVIDKINFSFYSTNIGENINDWINNKRKLNADELSDTILKKQLEFDKIIENKDNEVKMLNETLINTKGIKGYKTLESINNLFKRGK